jgi:hypothetical protein
MLFIKLWKRKSPVCTTVCSKLSMTNINEPGQWLASSAQILAIEALLGRENGMHEVEMVASVDTVPDTSESLPLRRSSSTDWPGDMHVCIITYMTSRSSSPPMHQSTHPPTHQQRVNWCQLCNEWHTTMAGSISNLSRNKRSEIGEHTMRPQSQPRVKPAVWSVHVSS